MGALATLIPKSDKEPLDWLKIYSLAECSTDKLDAFFSYMQASALVKKITFSKGLAAEPKHIVLYFEASVNPEEFTNHVNARFLACTGSGFKLIKA